jgi:hypothetical protein
MSEVRNGVINLLEQGIGEMTVVGNMENLLL